MGLTSARKSLQLCENVATILTVLIAACYQASHFVGPENFSSPIKQLHQALSAVVSQYRDTIPMSHYISQIRTFLLSEQGHAYLDTHVRLDEEGNT
jgi:histidine ammonia-lyase/tyrosine ammonia-lyase